MVSAQAALLDVSERRGRTNHYRTPMDCQGRYSLTEVLGMFSFIRMFFGFITLDVSMSRRAVLGGSDPQLGICMARWELSTHGDKERV